VEGTSALHKVDLADGPGQSGRLHVVWILIPVSFPNVMEVFQLSSGATPGMNMNQRSARP
jgi:hypothetical protein